MKPTEIEKRSFEIIEETLKNYNYNKNYEGVIKRVIHTTADFDYVKNLCFSENAVVKGISSIKEGAHIVTDTTMAMAGINKNVLAEYNSLVHCFIADDDVIRDASIKNTTRSAIAVDKALKIDRPLIFAIGNAPTALIRLCELIKEGEIMPELVIGVPVGFVNVIESKEMLMKLDVPFICAKGRKGGSNVAAAICNALLYER